MTQTRLPMPQVRNLEGMDRSDRTLAAVDEFIREADRLRQEVRKSKARHAWALYIGGIITGALAVLISNYPLGF